MKTSRTQAKARCRALRAIDDWWFKESWHQGRFPDFSGNSPSGKSPEEENSREDFIIGENIRRGKSSRRIRRGEWTVLPGRRPEMTHASGTKHNGKLYICGDNLFEEFSPKSNTWKAITEVPTRSKSTVLSKNNGFNPLRSWIFQNRVACVVKY